MKLRLIVFGHKQPAWMTAAYDDYARRLPRDFALDLIELKAEPRDRGKSTEQILAAEAQRIAPLTKGFHVVALDERGEQWTTTGLAGALSNWRDRGLPVAFVVGSADGIDPRFRSDADVVLALSALTLPHGLARVLLTEQLYRAVSVLLGHPYHRE